MLNIIVKWFNVEKVFCFIAPNDGGKDTYTYYSKIRSVGYKIFAEGQRVRFDVEEIQKGLSAKKMSICLI